MDDFLKSVMVERTVLVKMDSMVKELYDKDPMKDSPFAGFTLTNIIISVSDSYKKDLLEQKNAIGLSEDKIEEIIETVTQEIRNKYLE